MNKSEKLERAREKLHRAIEEYGVDSAEVRKISIRIDKLINEQYDHEVQYSINSEIKNNYYRCIEVLKYTVKDTGKFPCVKEWNRYAYNNNLLSHISIEYIAKMNWNQIEKMVRLDIK